VIVESTMPYLTVRTIVGRAMGSSGEVIIDCNPGDREIQSARLPLAATSNAGWLIVNVNSFVVLGELERIGYKFVAANSARKSSTEIWQVWTLHKEA